jgi:hypothetical protein
MTTINPILSEGADARRSSAQSTPVSFETEGMDALTAKSLSRVQSIEEDANVATQFSCFVNLCNTILGSGLLGLPYGNAMCQSSLDLHIYAYIVSLLI